MKLLLDFPTIGEPHYAQAIPASMIKDKQIKFFNLTENTNPLRHPAEKPRTASARRAAGGRAG